MRIIILFLLLLSTNVFSQNVSELEKKLDQTTDKEKKLSLYLALADSLIWAERDYAKGKNYAKHVVESCKEQQCTDQHLIAYGLISEVEINQNDYTTFEAFILPSLENKTTLPEHILTYYEELAGLYNLVKGNNTNAIQYFTNVLKILEEKKTFQRRLGKIYYHLGFAYNINSENKKSIAFLQKAVDQFSLSKDIPHILLAKSGLSILLATDGQYNEAIKLLLDAISITNASDDAQDIENIQLHSSLMELYIQSKNYKKAEKEFHKISPILSALDMPIEQKASDLWALHMSYSKLMNRVNRHEEGLRHVDSSYVYAQHLNEFCIQITDVRKASLLVNSGQYKKAESLIRIMLNEIKSSENKDAINAILVGLLSTIYSKSTIHPKQEMINNLLPIIDRIAQNNEGLYNLDKLEAEKLSTVLGVYTNDKTRALHSLSNVIEIKDSLQHYEKIQSTNELIVQYETREKEKMIEFQQLELKQKTAEKNSLIGFTLATVFALGIILLFYNQKKNYAQHLEHEVKKRTAELERSNQELIESKEELERYNYIASHDLKEPLRNVVSFVNLIKRKKLIANEDTLSYFDYIEKGAFQMNNIVQDLVNFTQLKSHKIEYQNIKTERFVEGLQKEFEQVVSKNPNAITFSHFPKSIVSDTTVLGIVFKNIIDNGLKFNDADAPFVNIEYQLIEDKHVFKFIDNGIGIEPKYHTRIFELFKRLNDRSKFNIGSGTGLPICKLLLKKIKGNISVKENIHNGTTFLVEIPNTQIPSNEKLQELTPSYIEVLQN